MGAATVRALPLWLVPLALTLGVLLALPATVRALPLWLAPFALPLGVLLPLPVCWFVEQVLALRTTDGWMENPCS